MAELPSKQSMGLRDPLFLPRQVVALLLQQLFLLGLNLGVDLCSSRGFVAVHSGLVLVNILFATATEENTGRVGSCWFKDSPLPSGSNDFCPGSV